MKPHLLYPQNKGVKGEEVWATGDKLCSTRKKGNNPSYANTKKSSFKQMTTTICPCLPNSSTVNFNNILKMISKSIYVMSCLVAPRLILTIKKNNLVIILIAMETLILRLLYLLKHIRGWTINLVVLLAVAAAKTRLGLSCLVHIRRKSSTSQVRLSNAF